jgi:hypothetical protein
MANAISTRIPDREIAIPPDLREWIDPHTLARLVLAAVQDLNVSTPPVRADCGHACRPHILLGLLTYCYAVGRYRSSDIEFNHDQDSMVRHLAADQYPEAHTLQSFRRHNKQSVKSCLMEVLLRAWQLHSRCGTPDFSSDPDEPSGGSGFDSHYAQPADSEFAAAAEERIQSAIRFDCWDVDP